MTDYFSLATGIGSRGQQPEAMQPAPVDYFSQATGIDSIGAKPQNAPQAGLKEGWGEWARNTVMGRQDPNEAHTGTVFDQFHNELNNPTAMAAKRTSFALRIGRSNPRRRHVGILHSSRITRKGRERRRWGARLPPPPIGAFV